jgi:putative tryptophan/tyrosine transport system substrate-binding protein
VKRREFITLIGGAATWPLAARAQQALPAIGFLHEGLPAPLSLTAAFQQGLIEAGVSAGTSLRIENGWAEGQYDRLPALAADLIDHRVGIIVALYLVAARAAKAATQTVPVVFITGSDPIVAGLVPSLSRPTSNLTGVAFMFTRLGEKNLATLHELVPKAVVIGALVNPNNPNAEPQTRDLQAAARTLGLQLVILAAGSDRDIDGIFATLRERQIEALLVTAPNAASSRVARYSFTARLAACAASSLLHSDPGIERCLLASATIRLESTAKPSPPTRPALMHAFTTRSNTLRKISLSRNRSLRARENAE